MTSQAGALRATHREQGFLGKTAALIRKDVMLEIRARDTLAPMMAFSLAVVLLLAFTLPGGSSLSRPVTVPLGTIPLADVLAGFLWVTILFGGLIGFSRTFENERHEQVLDQMLLAPVDRSALFLSKATANFFFIAIVQVVLVPAFVLFFGADPAGGWLSLVVVILLADAGFVTIGTLFSAVAAQTTSKELILPILALPALVPVFIGAVELTSDLFLGESVTEAGWFGILLGYDAVFAIVGILTFEFALER